MADRNYAAELMTASNAGPPAREPTYAERIANFFRPWTPEDRARVGAVMPPDLAPTQIVKGMVGGAADLAMQANQAMPWGGNYPQAIGIDPQSGTIDPSVMVPFAQNVAGMATTGSLAAPAVRNATGMGIRAYHGSPHDFDRFSMDKIGTGEGAQAYGHGLYFAENEAVSRGYRDALSSHEPTLEGRPFADSREYWQAFDDLEKTDWRQAKVLDEFTKTNGTRDDRLREIRNWHRADPEMTAAIDRMEARLDTKSSGRMYEVDINASPDEFLDWDKPLSEQPASVQAALGVTPEIRQALADHLQSGRKKTDYDPETWRLMRLADDNPMGSTLAGNKPETAEALRAAGIKGIRYKDAGSRATSGGELLGIDRGADGWKAKVRVTNRSGVGIQAPADMVTTSKAFPTEEAARQWAESKIGGGTSNYVVFDDNTINILKKYGIAGLTAGGAGAAMLGGTSDPASAAAPSYSTGGRF